MAKGKKSSSFGEAMRRQFKGQWAKHRQATSDRADNETIIDRLGLKPGDSVSVEARVSNARAGTDRNDNPYFVVDYLGTRGDAKALPLNRYYSIQDRGNMSAGMAMEMLASDLKILGYRDVGDSDEDYVDEVAHDLCENKPLVRLNVVLNDKGYVNVYLDRLVSAHESTERSAETDDEDQDEEEESSDAEDDAEDAEVEADEEEGGDDEDVIIEKGDLVLYAENGSVEEYKVLSVIGDVANLSRISDKKRLSKVPLSALEVVFED